MKKYFKGVLFPILALWGIFLVFAIPGLVYYLIETYTNIDKNLNEVLSWMTCLTILIIFIKVSFNYTTEHE